MPTGHFTLPCGLSFTLVVPFVLDEDSNAAAACWSTYSPAFGWVPTSPHSALRRRPPCWWTNPSTVSALNIMPSPESIPPQLET